MMTLANLWPPDSVLKGFEFRNAFSSVSCFSFFLTRFEQLCITQILSLTSNIIACSYPCDCNFLFGSLLVVGFFRSFCITLSCKSRHDDPNTFWPHDSALNCFEFRNMNVHQSRATVSTCLQRSLSDRSLTIRGYNF